MGQALYRKYRSRSFNDVIGQEHIVETLKRALSSGRISHAYLFTGPKGVGKTSVARILAHEVNNLPYTDESIHLDIIEIDAASNRRIDEVRDLREKVHIAPSSAKYKVYIIDEVHMLTKEAFNAILKTLEEPPPHCIFVLATTEGHKLPETIISRTQRFAFRPVGKKQAANRLQKIARAEKIDITPEALMLLAEHGDGSFRDSISLLDQLSGAKQPISEATVRESLGLPPEQVINDLADSLAANNSAGIINTLTAAREQALDPAAIATDLSRRLRDSFIDEGGGQWISQLLKSLLEVAGSSYPYQVLEINLLESASVAKNSADSLSPKLKSTSALSDGNKKFLSTPLVIPEKTRKARLSSAPKDSFKLEDWPQVVEKVKAEAASLYTALRLAQPHLSSGRLSLKFQFPLHQKKISQAKSKDLIGKIIETMSGSRLVIDCLVDKSMTTMSKSASAPLAADEITKTGGQQVQTISNIFGGAEVLES